MSGRSTFTPSALKVGPVSGGTSRKFDVSEIAARIETGQEVRKLLREAELRAADALMAEAYVAQLCGNDEYAEALVKRAERIMRGNR